jgi:hypothetical protein
LVSSESLNQGLSDGTTPVKIGGQVFELWSSSSTAAKRLWHDDKAFPYPVPHIPQFTNSLSNDSTDYSTYSSPSPSPPPPPPLLLLHKIVMRSSSESHTPNLLRVLTMNLHTIAPLYMSYSIIISSSPQPSCIYQFLIRTSYPPFTKSV